MGKQTINLECQLYFAKKPIEKLQWLVNGNLQIYSDQLQETNADGDVAIYSSLKLDLKASMDSSIDTCSYNDGYNIQKIETALNVFGLDYLPGNGCL